MRGLQMTGLPCRSVAVVFGLACAAFSDSSGHNPYPRVAFNILREMSDFAAPSAKKPSLS